MEQDLAESCPHSVGSLLLTDRLIEKEMNELCFVGRETCIFADKEDFLQKVAWIISEENRPEVDRIRHAGMELVRERHRTLQVNNLANSCLASVQL